MKRPINCTKSNLASVFLGIFLTAFIVSTGLAETEPPEKTLAWCELLITEASEMAFRAQVLGDYPTANQALNQVYDAAYLVEKVSRLVQQETVSSQLAYSTYNASNQVATAIVAIIKAAEHIATHNSNPDVVHAANFLLDCCELLQEKNKETMGIALMSFSDISEKAEAFSK